MVANEEAHFPDHRVDVGAGDIRVRENAGRDDAWRISSLVTSVLRGKPLIINVWASWCGPCRAEMGSLDRLSRRFGGKQFNIIGVSTDDHVNLAAAFLTQAKVSFDNYHDRNLLLESMLGADTIPLTVLIDAKGRVLKKVRGSKQWDSPESLEFIGMTFGKKL